MQLRINVDFQLRSFDAALDDWRRSQRFVEVARHRQSQSVDRERARATRRTSIATAQRDFEEIKIQNTTKHTKQHTSLFVKKSKSKIKIIFTT